MENSYPFAAGVIKSLENKIIKRSVALKLKDKSLSDSILSLNEAGFGSGGLTLDELCLEEEQKANNVLIKCAPRKEEIQMFFLIKDAQNIKMLYKSKIFNLSVQDDFAYTLFDFNELKDLILNNKESSSKILNKEIKEINKLISGKKLSAKELSLFIDQTIIKNVLNNLANNSPIREYIKTLIDYTNFKSLLRMINLNWNSSELKNVFFEGGSIPYSLFEKAFENGLSKLNDSFKNVSNDFDKLKECFIKYHDFNKLETLIEQLLLDHIKVYSNDGDSVGPLLYFYLEINAEIFNIKKVFGDASIELSDLLEF